MDIYYRIASFGDLQEICNLVKAAIDTMEKNNIFQWDDLYPTVKDFEDDINKNQLYVGILDKHIAVVYVLNQKCDKEYKNGNWKYADKPFCVIHRLCVNPIFQNKGIANYTMKHIENQVLSLGIKAVRLDVFSKNPFAIKLYNNLGYVRVGNVNWRKGKFYLMEKYL